MDEKRHISYDNPYESTMNMRFIRKLPIPRDVKQKFPVPDHLREVRLKNIRAIRAVLSGESDKMLLIIGPCSADREDSVLEYVTRLAKLRESVCDKIVLVPRVYTNKPRTVGLGYKGMLHQPDPEKGEDMLEGIISIRKMHTDVVEQTGFTCAEEMLYPENHRYLSDLLAYVAVGARSVEDQQHRLTSSGISVPVGMKNPTSGDYRVMMNAISAAQNGHTFI
jgi:3-deoxy-7-phosphoheptulonate synthase